MAKPRSQTRQAGAPPVAGDTEPEPSSPPPAIDEITLPPAEAVPPSGESAGGNGDTPPVDIDRIREDVRREIEGSLQQRMQAMDDELAQFRQEREARQAAEAAEQARLADEARRAEEEDLSARELLERERNTWAQERSQINQRFEDMEADRARQTAILEQERRLNAIRDYREKRIGEEADDIMPQLRDMVSGTTEEEIEASINVLKERSASILESVAQAQGQQSRVPGPKVTHPPVGPMDQQAGQETLSASDIEAMDLNQYAQVRDRLLGAVSRRVSESGPYGR